MSLSVQRRWWNLKSKLIVSFSLLIAAVLVFVQMLDIWGLPIIRDDGREGQAWDEAFVHLGIIADMKVEHLVHDIQKKTTDVQMLFGNQLVRSKIVELRRFYETAKAQGESWKQLAERASQEQPCHRHLADLFHHIQANFSAYRNIQLADPCGGEILISTRPSEIGTNLFAEVPADQSRSAIVPRILPLEFCTRIGSPTLRMVYAITESPIASEPIALLLVDLDPEDIVQPLIYLGEQVAEGTEAVVVDEQGRNVATLQHPLPDGTQPEPLSCHIESLLVQKAASGENGQIEAIDYRGVPVLATYRSIPVTPQWRWGLILKRDRDALMAPVRRDIARTGILSMVAIALSVLLTVRLSSHLIRPILSLSEVADRVAGGDLSARAAMLGNDQIGHLARQFNDMVERMANWQQELEQQVRYRTEKLKQTEDTLRSVLQFNQEIISGAGEGIVVYDTQLRYRVWNQMMERLTGLSASQVIGKLATELFPHLLEQGNVDLIRRALAGETIATRVVPYVIPSTGRNGWVLVTYSPHRDHDNQIVGVIGTVRDVTARKEAEEALRQSEERFRQLAEHSDDVFWLTDVNSHHVLYVNPAYETIWGRSTVALTTNPSEWLDAILPEDRPQILQVMQQQAAGIATFSEYRIQRPDGSILWIHDRGYPIYDEQGNVYRIAGIAENITAQKLATDALEESENRFRLLSENSLTGVYILQDNRYRYVNPAFCDMLKRSSDELLGLDPVADMVHPDDQALVRDRIRQREEGHLENAHYTTRYIRGDGRPIFCEVLGRRIEYGGRSAIIGNILDVTDRKLAEDALADSEAKYRGLFRNMLDGFALHEIVLDANGQPIDYRFLSVNPAFEQLTGLKAVEIVGKRVREVLPDIEPFWIEIYGQVVLTGIPAQFERFSPALGKHFEICAFRPRPGQFATVFQDITQRRQAEEELARHREHLEELVEERTAELKAVNRELEAFSYSVSHDLRGPLRAVDGFSQALMDDFGAKLEPAAMDYLARIRGASQRMGQLIDDLLKLSRVTRAEMHPESLNLTVIAQEIATELKAADSTRQVQFEITPNLQAQGDSRLMRLALLNLLGNSWKFTGKHSTARIEFGVSREPERTVFFIRDDGAGFDMTYADKLFGAFQRLHKLSEFEGTGIGLATVQRVIHRHGGQVWADGRVEGGATFFFTLP